MPKTPAGRQMKKAPIVVAIHPSSDDGMRTSKASTGLLTKSAQARKIPAETVVSR